MPTVPTEGGARRRCTNRPQHKLYPRTDPVVGLLAGWVGCTPGHFVAAAAALWGAWPWALPPKARRQLMGRQLRQFTQEGLAGRLPAGCIMLLLLLFRAVLVLCWCCVAAGHHAGGVA